MIFFQIFEYVDFVQNFRKISILVTIVKNLDFPQMFGNHDIGERFRKILVLANFFVNIVFCQHFGKLSRFWSKFLNLATVVKILDKLHFGQHFRENLYLRQNF